MLERLSMGGYGVYVWTSLGLVLGLMLIQSWRARQVLKRAKQALAWSQDVES